MKIIAIKLPRFISNFIRFFKRKKENTYEECMTIKEEIL